MNDIATYEVRKNNKILKKGLSPTFYLHGIMASTMEKFNADEIEIKFNNGRDLKIQSPRLLFKNIPNGVSIEEHCRWFEGCHYPLEF